MKPKINWSLWIAILMPLVLVGVVGLSLYFPSKTASFQGRFVYALSDNWHGGSRYTVTNGQINFVEVADPYAGLGYVKPSTATVHLFVHDLSTDRSESISFEAARSLVLNPVPTSPEGLLIAHGRGGDSGLFPFFFFGSSTDYSSAYVTGKKTSKRLNIAIQQPGRYQQFIFIGWVKS